MTAETDGTGKEPGGMDAGDPPVPAAAPAWTPDAAPDAAIPPDAELLLAVFADLGAGLCLTDHSGRITAVNPHAMALLERPAGALVGADAHDLLHRDAAGAPIPRSECVLLPVLEHGRTVHGDGECDAFLDGNGHLRPIDWAASPIRRDGRIRGAAVLFGDASDRRAAARRQADQLAAVERLTGRLAAVSEISTVLARTPEEDEALGRLVRLLVPRLADWAAVDVCTGLAEVRRVSVASPVRGPAPPGVAALQGGTEEDPAVWLGPLPPVTDSSRAPLARVLRGGEALLLGPDDIAAAGEGPLDAAHGELFAAFGAASVIIAPLRTARGVLGALTVARTEPARPFDASELMLIADIGRRAGLAVDNARLAGRQGETAETVQRHLLAPLPESGRLRLAAGYRPGGREGARIGGDWYDALVLSDGVTALVIGDAAGRGLPAAAHMAQLRNMLHCLIWDRTEPPSLVIDRFEEAMIFTTDIVTATVILARVEGPLDGPWQLHWVSAGHPPPLLVTADGETRYLETGQNPLLGVGVPEPGSRFDAIEPLPADGTVLLYTDGLIEVPGGDLDAGMDRLRRHAAALARHPVDELCDQLLERMPSGGTDDAALLALRLPGE
ncbi:SpoIIE family protein phosphatase [Spirillospora albida]|uniref:SpoIIE family protein phosphatase n=1 Tax=Spirillospora albida TaxID=58123 RepID=UPI00068E4D96|nr:SpoIIE family protein phosphatase [Spirillospora albida]